MIKSARSALLILSDYTVVATFLSTLFHVIFRDMLFHVLLGLSLVLFLYLLFAKLGTNFWECASPLTSLFSGNGPSSYFDKKFLREKVSCLGR